MITIKLTLILEETSKVNLVHSMQLKNTHKSSGRKKKKNKSKKGYTNSGKQQSQGLPTRDNKRKCMVKISCFVYGKDDATKHFPHLVELQQYVKGQSSQLEVLTNPFCPQQQQMVTKNPIAP